MFTARYGLGIYLYKIHVFVFKALSKKKDRPCTYDVTLRPVRATAVVVGKQ